MTDLSKLSNLFNAQQRLTAYNTSSKKRTDEQKELADMNGDGKIDSKDKTLINKQINDIKKDNPYDLNSDGKTNITDWLLLGDEIDLDGDGTVSDEEKAFIASQKKTMASTVQKSVVSEKYTGEFNGKYYANGKTATGIYEGTYYRNGVKGTGIANNTYYKNGVPATGSYSGKYYVEGSLANGSVTTTVNKKEVTYMYKDGVKLTGFADDGKYYASGTAKTGYVTIKENGKNVVYYFVNGEKANGKAGNYMYQGGKKLTGTADDGLYYKYGLLYSGNIYNDTNTTKYKKGVMQYSVTDNNKSNYPNLSSSKIRFRNGNKYTNIALQTGDSVVINKDGMTEITDKSGSAKLYDSTGALFSGTYNDKTYENGVEIQETPPSETNPPTPTTEPTTEPTPTPTTEPTPTPTTEPTPTPTTEPTPTPTTEPTTEPTPDPTPDPTDDPLSNPDAEVTGREYSLAGLKEITVNGKIIKINGLNANAQGKIVVEDSGRINIYVEGQETSNITFNTTENLDIVLRKSVNASFSLVGGSGNDNITLSKGVTAGQIEGGAGNDVMTNYGTIKYFMGNEGNDTMINEENATITEAFSGHDGNDNMVNKGTSSKMEAGAGDDYMYNFGDSGSMNGGDGNDHINNEATGITSGSIKGENGDDTIINHGLIEGNITGDDGNDYIKNDGVITSKKGQGTGSIQGGSGNDTIDNSKGMVKSNIQGGSGDDKLEGEGKHGARISASDFENINSERKANIDPDDLDLDKFKEVIKGIRNDSVTDTNDTINADNVDDLKETQRASMFDKEYENVWKEFEHLFQGMTDIFSDIWDWLEKLMKNIFG